MINLTPALLTTLKDFVQFLRKPDDVQISATPQRKLVTTLIFLILEFAITLAVIAPVLSVIDEALDLQYHDTEAYTLMQKVLFIILLIPFIEELVFRYALHYQGLKTRLINRKNWNAIFPVLVYFSVFCFAAIHLSNYDNRTALFYYLAPIIVLSQFFGGLIMAYIRVRFGFRWGVLYHCIWNLIVVLLP